MGYKVLTSSSNVGLGFRTSFCVAARDFFGGESKKFLQKQEWSAQDLCGDFNQKGVNYTPVFLSVARQGSLMFSGTLQLEECKQPKDIHVTFACSNLGLGYITSISEGYASLWGRTSFLLIKKQYEMIDNARSRLDAKISENYEGWEVVQTVQVLNKRLGVTLFAVLVRDHVEEVQPAPIEEEPPVKEEEIKVDATEEIITRFEIIKEFTYHGYKFKEGMTGTVIKQLDTTSIVEFDSNKLHGSFTVSNDCISTATTTRKIN